MSAASLNEFVAQTWSMMNAGHGEITWNSDGTQIMVTNAEKLAVHVLPQYFRHGQFSSFVRALNAYNFKKIAANRWSHPAFLRGRPELIATIRRKQAPPRVRNKSGAGAGAGAATSTALVQHPQKPLVASPQQQWQWMQAEMMRLHNELHTIRRDEFTSRFNFVGMMQMLLKRGVAPTFLPAFKGMAKCKMLTAKCQLLQLRGCRQSAPRSNTSSEQQQPLSRDAAAAMLTRAIRMRAVLKAAASASSPPALMKSALMTGAAAVALAPPLRLQRSDESEASLDSQPSSSRTATADIEEEDLELLLPSIPASPSRMSDVDIDDLGFDYHDYDAMMVRGDGRGEGSGGGGGSGGPSLLPPVDEPRVTEIDDAMSDDAARTPVIAAGGGGGRCRWMPPTSQAIAINQPEVAPVEPCPSQQQRGALRFACVLAAMPQLPASTSKLPPEGSKSRAQIEAAVNLAFKQLTISPGPHQQPGRMGGVFEQGAATPMLVSSMA